MTLLFDLAIRASVMLAIGLLLSASLAKRSAALRHRVLAAAVLVAAVVMPFSLVLPEWTVTLPARPAIDLSSREALPAHTAAPLAAPVEPPGRGAAASQSSSSQTISFIVMVWFAGAVATAGALIVGLVRVNHLAARASQVDEAQWLDILHTVAERYGLTRQIVLARTDSPDLLATWGILRPHVLLPDHADGWTLDRVHVVLCHELAHIRRHDWPVQICGEALRAVLWFNPLAWMVCTRLRRDSEQACDDEVLGIGVGGREYAAHLLYLARLCRRPGLTWASPMPMAHPSTLERRIAAMLNPGLDRRPPSRRVIAAIAVVLLLLALPVAAIRASQAGPAPLSGTIYDVTGGVLPSVEVTLADANQNTWVATSDASGRFEFPPVGPGTYRVETTLAGFRTLRHDFELRDPRDWNRAITLQVADLQETVRVLETRVTASQQSLLRPPPRAPVRVGGNIRPPMKIKDVRPSYPPSMREAGLSGVVPVEAIIGRDGAVSSVRVLSAHMHPDFAIAAVDAVRQWRFTPTLLNGETVEVVMTVRVRFDLED